MKGKAHKDITIARMSLKQAISVAVISLCSAVAVAMITQRDRNAQDPETEEAAFYTGRATAVDQAFGKAEEKLASLLLVAESVGDEYEAEHLKRVIAETRGSRMQAHTLHLEHIQALQARKRIEASEIRLRTNSLIIRANYNIDAVTVLKPAMFRRQTYIEGSRRAIEEMRAGIFITETVSNVSEMRIPLYGKNVGSRSEVLVAG